MVGQVALVGGAAVHVAEITVDRRSRASMRLAQRSCDGVPVEAKLHRARCCGGDGEQQILSPRLCSVPIINAAERPKLVSEARRNAERLASAVAGRWMLRSNSPGRSTFAWSPVTKSTAATSRAGASRGQACRMPSSADGQRNHRTRRQ